MMYVCCWPECVCVCAGVQGAVRVSILVCTSGVAKLYPIKDPKSADDIPCVFTRHQVNETRLAVKKYKSRNTEL